MRRNTLEPIISTRMTIAPTGRPSDASETFSAAPAVDSAPRSCAARVAAGAESSMVNSTAAAASAAASQT